MLTQILRQIQTKPGKATTKVMAFPSRMADIIYSRRGRLDHSNVRRITKWVTSSYFYHSAFAHIGTSSPKIGWIGSTRNSRKDGYNKDMGAILKEYISTCRQSRNYPGYSKDKIRREAHQLVYARLMLKYNHTTIVNHSLEIKKILDKYS